MTSEHKDHPIQGVAFALSAAIMLSTMNMFAKLLGEFYSPIEISFYRNIIAIVLLLGGLAVLGKLSLLKTKRPKAQFIRSIVGTIGMIFTMWTVTILPLTTATALIFTAPLFVVLMSYPLLKEPVGLMRLTAVAIGFLGVILIAQPENDVSLTDLMIGLIAGFLNGLVAICLRWLGNTESTATTNFYFLFYGLIGTSLAMPFIGEMPTVETSPWIVGVGIVGLLSLLLKTQGFRLGPAALISPISYTMMIWAITFDYFIWNTVPNIAVTTGATIIISSNIFILWRENRKIKNV
jgi:drug/metabolite transporter (DMT)-like permease